VSKIERWPEKQEEKRNNKLLEGKERKQKEKCWVSFVGHLVIA